MEVELRNNIFCNQHDMFQRLLLRHKHKVIWFFSMYLLKPAPFCIFDEVDAPLDDANIDKFNNIIRSFSKESQFVIVTHNKRTMSTTDVIYGITMIEKGISRVVPVDLRELA